jgi:hypothetical protein
MIVRLGAVSIGVDARDQSPEASDGTPQYERGMPSTCWPR